MTSHDETDLPDWAAGLAEMNEAEFLSAWQRIVGEPPAAILPRDEMIALLAGAIGHPPAHCEFSAVDEPAPARTREAGTRPPHWPAAFAGTTVESFAYSAAAGTAGLAAVLPPLPPLRSARSAMRADFPRRSRR